MTFQKKTDVEEIKYILADEGLRMSGNTKLEAFTLRPNLVEYMIEEQAETSLIELS